MTAPESTVSIDWLTCTLAIDRLPGESRGDVVERMARWVFKSAPVPGAVPYPRNYTESVGLDYGRLSWHPDQPGMKTCYVLTGADCASMVSDGKSPVDRLKMLVDQGAHFTRVDVAIDYFGYYDLNDVIDHFDDQPRWTNARVLTPYSQIDYKPEEGVREQITGVYLGSRKSEVFICMYNKALEQDQPGDRLRIELRAKGRYAGGVADMIDKQGLPMTARAAIIEYANPPLGWFQDALSGPLGQGVTVGKRETDTRRWLLEIILPVLDRELAKVDTVRDPLYSKYKHILDKATNRLFGR